MKANLTIEEQRMHATDFVQQKQTVKHPATGEELEVVITQYFVYTPGVHYRGPKGDPGDPPSTDELGEPIVTLADGSPCPPWVEDALINWDLFDEADMKTIQRDNPWAVQDAEHIVQQSRALPPEHFKKLLEGDWESDSDRADPSWTSSTTEDTDTLGNNYSDADPGL